MKIKETLKKIAYTGNKRYCPLCGKKAGKFDIYGLKGRPDARCIHCGSLERHRLLWLYLTEKTDLFSRKSTRRMLHIAPERCLEVKFHGLFGDGYITADLNNPQAQVKMDITEIPFEDQSFDIIYCSHVLEHVPDDRKAIREFYRVLKDGGLTILMVPVNVDKTIEDPSITDPKERERLFGQYDHVRKYGPDFIDRAREAGFKTERILPSDFLNEERIVHCSTTDHTPIYHCTK